MKVNFVSITDVCDFQGGFQPPKNEWSLNPKEKYIRMLQIRDFTQGKKEYIAYVRETPKLKKCEKSDVLIGRYGASLGKILSGLSGAYNVAIMKAIPNSDKLDKKFLYFLLKNQSFQNFIHNVGIRAAQAGFSKKDLRKYKFFLPENLNDQIKIANLLTQVESLIAKREESIELLDELLRSSFLDMFGTYDKLDYRLEELCSEIVDCPHSTPKYSDNKTEFSCLRTSEFSNGQIDYSSMKYINEEEYLKRVKRLVPKFGDIIYAREGSYGDAVRVPKKSLICLGQRTMLFRPKIEICNSIFLWALVRSDMVFRQAKKKNKGATVGRVNVKDIKEFKVFLPPKPLQDKFATIVQQLEESKEKYQKSLDELRDLFGSLSQRAFKGELDLSKMELTINKLEDKPLENKVYEPKLTNVETVSIKSVPTENLESYIFDLIKRDDFSIEKIEQNFNYDEVKNKIFEMLEDGKIKQKFKEEYKEGKNEYLYKTELVTSL